MSHPYFQANGIAIVEDNTITIDFSNMPLRQLVAMRRLGEDMSAKTCGSWFEAAEPAKKALFRYLDTELDPKVYSKKDFEIIIDVAKDVDATFQAVVGFFNRENITVAKPSGIRGLASA